MQPNKIYLLKANNKHLGISIIQKNLPIPKRQQQQLILHHLSKKFKIIQLFQVVLNNIDKKKNNLFPNNK